MKIVNNYFRVGQWVYGFDQRNPAAIADAYNMALQDSADGYPVVVYRMPPRHMGPWRNCEIVGHRSESAIRGDIRRTERGDPDPDWNLESLQDELTARNIARGTIL